MMVIPPPLLRVILTGLELERGIVGEPTVRAAVTLTEGLPIVQLVTAVVESRDIMGDGGQCLP
ncbi:MAG: hypothetical protein ACLP4R_30430 [Solirubrobacteraceae bacterium]